MSTARAAIPSWPRRRAVSLRDNVPRERTAAKMLVVIVGTCDIRDVDLGVQRLPFELEADAIDGLPQSPSDPDAHLNRHRP